MANDTANHAAELGAGRGTLAEEVLAALRRDHLVRSWRHRDASADIHSTVRCDGGTEIGTEVDTHGVFEVVVGRGTVRLRALDAAGVVRLADQLRRDKVTVVGSAYAIGYRTVRYPLSDGRFADRHDSRIGRYVDEFPYTVYLPGGDPSGCAAVSFAARTQKEALALAGLTRVRGRCCRCHQLRPLHVDGWRPDPAIPCPGCGADARTPASVLCHAVESPSRTPSTSTGGRFGSPGTTPTRASRSAPPLDARACPR